MGRDPSQAEPSRLSIYRFEPGAALEGGIIGALERMGGRDGPRLLDALFVAHDPDSGDLQAVDLVTGLADGTVATLLDFRLDPARRRAVTERTLADHAGAVPRPVVEAIGAALEPGGAILAVLVAGGVPTVLQDAVSRSGGRLLSDQRVHAATLADLLPQLRAAR